MEKLDRNKRMAELKMKSQRKNICSNLIEIIDDLNIDAFISIDETIEISNRVYDTIDYLDCNKKIDKDLQICISEILNLKKEYYKYSDDYAVLFHADDRECGAFMIKVSDFFDHLAYILDFTSFSKGCRDLIYVDKKLRFGICVERYEYFNVLAKWKDA